jgi:hypothetical protein
MYRLDLTLSGEISRNSLFSCFVLPRTCSYVLSRPSVETDSESRALTNLSAHACSENGVKWFLFLFFDLGAVLCFECLSKLLAVPAFLESAEVFEASKGQRHDFDERI